MPQSATQGSVLRDLLGDGTDPVAVFLLAPDQDNGAFAGFAAVRGHRYCQALNEGAARRIGVVAARRSVLPSRRRGIRVPPAAAATGERQSAGGIRNRSGSRHRQAYVRWHVPACRRECCCHRTVPAAPYAASAGCSRGRRPGGGADVAIAGGSECPWRGAADGRYGRSSGYVCGCHKLFPIASSV